MNMKKEKMDLGGGTLESKKKKRKVMMVSLSIVLVLVLLLGLSYAWFTLTLTGTKQNVIKVGNLSLNLSEGEAIQLNAAVPILDRDALEGDPYQFIVVNDGTIDSEFQLYFRYSLEQTSVLDEITNFALKKNGKVVLLDAVSKLDQSEQVLDLGVMKAGEENRYELYLWLDSTTTKEDLEDTGEDVNKLIGTIELKGSQLKERSLMRAFKDQMSHCTGTACVVNDEGDTHYVTIDVQSPYVWYSGKMWRLISYNDNGEIKAITNSPQTVLPWGSSEKFTESNVYTWINDSSRDGFLGNLYHYEDFLVTDYPWNYSATTPDNIWTSIGNDTIVRGPVGILNTWDLAKGATGDTEVDHNFLTLSILLRSSLLGNYIVSTDGNAMLVLPSFQLVSMGLGYVTPSDVYGTIFPAVVFKDSVKVVSGSGTETDPYLLKGDERTRKDALNTAMSGEYVAFGDTQNSIYRVSGIEDGKTKVVLANPLVETFTTSTGNMLTRYASGNKTTTKLLYYTDTDDYTVYDATSTSYPIAYFLNHGFLDERNGYFTSEDLSMIEQNSTWYLNFLTEGQDDYKNATKNTSVATVGFLKAGDQMSFVQKEENRYTYKWNALSSSGTLLLTSNGTGLLAAAYDNSSSLSFYNKPSTYQYRPSVYLKSGVKIKSGRGTRYDPYVLTME